MKEVKELISAEKKFGYYYLYIGSVISIIVSIFMILIGYYLNFYSEKGWIKTTGKVIKMDNPCIRTESKNSVNYKCEVDIAYDGKTLKNQDITNDTNLGVGSKLDVSYDPNNPDDVDVGHDVHFIGVMLMIIGVVIIIFSLILLYFKDNKWVQTWYGLKGLHDLL